MRLYDINKLDDNDDDTNHDVGDNNDGDQDVPTTELVPIYTGSIMSPLSGIDSNDDNGVENIETNVLRVEMDDMNEIKSDNDCEERSLSSILALHTDDENDNIDNNSVSEVP